MKTGIGGRGCRCVGVDAVSRTGGVVSPGERGGTDSITCVLSAGVGAL